MNYANNHPAINKQIGHFFRRARRNAGFTQCHISHVLGFKNGQYVSNLERGLCSVPFQVIVFLLKVYRIDTVDFIEYMAELGKHNLELRFALTEEPKMIKTPSLIKGKSKRDNDYKGGAAMHILICESREELLVKHILKFKKIFYPLTFEYAQTTEETINCLKYDGQEYDFIVCSDHEQTMEEIYRTISEQKLIPSFFLISDTSKLETRNEDDFFCLKENYTSDDLDKISNVFVAKSMA